uniref:metal-sensing transcriptional repressor n=1 Tax=Fusobacterium perfoetens TaxID=852 RepID=UPI0026F2568D
MKEIISKNSDDVFCLSSTEDFRKKLISRINRIAGQLRGIERMILNHVKCDEILNQVSSVKSALNGIAKVVLEAHLRNCVVHDIKSG